MLKGKLKGTNAATEDTNPLSFPFSPPPLARHPLRLISEIDRLLARWNRLERALYRQPPVLLADAWHVGAVTSLWSREVEQKEKRNLKVLMAVALSSHIFYYLLHREFIFLLGAWIFSTLDELIARSFEDLLLSYMSFLYWKIYMPFVILLNSKFNENNSSLYVINRLNNFI